MYYIPYSSEIFVPPFIGNGEMTLQISPDGTMSPIPGNSLISGNPSRRIWWESRRNRTLHTRPLVPFGLFTQELTRDGSGLCLQDSEETLDCPGARVLCHTRYQDGTILDTEAFIHAKADVIVLKKQLIPTDGMIDYRFTYRFASKESDEADFPEFISGSSSSDGDGAVLRYRMTDQKTCGCIRLICDRPVDYTAEGNTLSFSLSVSKPESFCIYLIFTDTQGLYPDHLAQSENTLREIREEGYEAFRASHAAVWDAYYQEGYARTGDDAIDRAYLTSQYHLRIFATRWSMPVGLNDSTWDGRFFGFDEHYMFSGLLTANHLDIARRVPEFRAKGLPIAVSRFSYAGQNEAYYPWETLEDGTEAAPPGHWMEHIFHMAVITLSEYEYYLFSGDEAFLKNTAWPVIRACAELYYKHFLYRIEGAKLIVGKCTDLERLGASVANAYMTSCGVISTFRVFAACARHLGEEIELAAVYEKAADDLFAGLPVEDGRFVPYPGCPDRSISAFSGTYPFDVVPRDDPHQTAAIEDFVEKQDSFGNMYQVGSGVCSWYACWKAITYARLKQSDKAFSELSYVANTAGDFHELFEINNRKSRTYIHPWFTTAAGKYVHAVNEVLLQSSSDGSDIFIVPALKELPQDFSFRLAARGGLTVEAKTVNGELNVRVIGKEYCTLKAVRVHIPERFGKDFTSAVESYTRPASSC